MLWGHEFYNEVFRECVEKFGEVSGERLLAVAVGKLVREKDSCPHPGCCCVCGHTGKCPEDGPSIVEGVES